MIKVFFLFSILTFLLSCNPTTPLKGRNNRYFVIEENLKENAQNKDTLK